MTSATPRCLRIFSLLLLLSTALFAGCKKEAAQAAPPARPPMPVTVAVAETHDVPLYLDEIGQTNPSEMVQIQAQVSGEILKRSFTDGADLKKGQPLFSIDPRTYQAAVEQAQANLEQSIAQQALAKAEFDRYSAALQTKAASQSDYDTKKAALDSAIAQVKINQAALKTAQINLDYCNITSPINGRAGERLVDAGNIVKANDTKLVGIQDLSPIYADFTIVEADLPHVRQRMADHTLQTLVSLPQSPNETRPGELTFLDTNVQPGAGRINLRATLPNTDRYFWPGQFVNVRLILETLHDAVLVPYACVQQGQQGMFVYVVKKDSTVEQRPVTLGLRQRLDNRELIVLKTGVNAGEQIVETGQLAIGPGAAVKVVPAELPKPAPAETPTTETTTQPASQPKAGGAE